MFLGPPVNRRRCPAPLPPLPWSGIEPETSGVFFESQASEQGQVGAVTVFVSSIQFRAVFTPEQQAKIRQFRDNHPGWRMRRMWRNFGAGANGADALPG